MKALTVLAIFAAFIAMYYAVPYVHELAHAAVCESSGHNTHLHIAFTGEARALTCSGQPDNPDLYHAVGGLAGLALSAVIAFGIRNRIAFVAAFPFVPQQALIAGMETLAYQWYIDDSNSIPPTVASLLTLAIFFVLLLTYSINSKKRGSKASQDEEQRRKAQ